MGAALIHLIPDAADEMLAMCKNDIPDSEDEDCYPYGHLWALIGVLLVPITEELVVSNMTARDNISNVELSIGCGVDMMMPPGPTT